MLKIPTSAPVNPGNAWYLASQSDPATAAAAAALSTAEGIRGFRVQIEGNTCLHVVVCRGLLKWQVNSADIN